MRYEPEEKQYEAGKGMFDFEKRGGCIPFAPHVAPKEKQIRLSKQSAAVLERLRLGPATNRQLMEIALNYTARISDIRAEGIKIPKPTEDLETGLSMYHLEDKT